VQYELLVRSSKSKDRFRPDRATYPEVCNHLWHPSHGFFDLFPPVKEHNSVVLAADYQDAMALLEKLCSFRIAKQHCSDTDAPSISF
jgi:hypothetical protein